MLSGRLGVSRAALIAIVLAVIVGGVAAGFLVAQPPSPTTPTPALSPTAPQPTPELTPTQTPQPTPQTPTPTPEAMTPAAPLAEVVEGVSADLTIELSNFAYSDESPRIEPGMVVKFVNVEGSHTVTWDEAGIDVVLAQGESVLIRFNSAPEPDMVAEVYCRFHGRPGSGMHSNVSVGGEAAAEMPVTAAPEEVTPDFVITIKEWSYTVEGLSGENPTLFVDQFKRVVVKVVNEGTLPHTFTILELNADTGLLSPGESAIIEFTASRGGKFTYFCAVEGHRELGLEGEITVLRSAYGY